jgi:hypothetical protein
MKRREFMAGSAAVAFAFSSRATAADSWRIGQVIGGTPENSLSGFELAFSDLGYVEGKNIHLETRHTAPIRKT